MRSYERIIAVPGLSNLGRVGAGIYRSARPTLYEALPQYLGIKAVLNLQTTRDIAEVAGLGMISLELPLIPLAFVEPRDFDGALSVMQDKANWPLLVHCRQGHDRTGVICAAYRLMADGWSLAEAEEEMQTYGFNNLWFPLLKSLRDYAREKGFK